MVLLTTLSTSEEEHILKQLKKEALMKCSHLTKALAECTKHRTITVYFACLEENRLLNECLKPHTTQEKYHQLKQSFLDNKSSS